MKRGENLVNMIPPAFTKPACIIAETGVEQRRTQLTIFEKAIVFAGIITASIMNKLITVLSNVPN